MYFWLPKMIILLSREIARNVFKLRYTKVFPTERYHGKLVNFIFHHQPLCLSTTVGDSKTPKIISNVRVTTLSITKMLLLVRTLTESFLAIREKRPVCLTHLRILNLWFQVVKRRVGQGTPDTVSIDHAHYCNYIRHLINANALSNNDGIKLMLQVTILNKRSSFVEDTRESSKIYQGLFCAI